MKPPKRIPSKFSFPQKSWNRIFRPPKILCSSPTLEIRRTHSPHQRPPASPGKGRLKWCDDCCNFPSMTFWKRWITACSTTKPLGEMSKEGLVHCYWMFSYWGGWTGAFYLKSLEKWNEISYRRKGMGRGWRQYYRNWELLWLKVLEQAETWKERVTKAATLSLRSIHYLMPLPNATVELDWGL